MKENEEKEIKKPGKSHLIKGFLKKYMTEKEAKSLNNWLCLFLQLIASYFVLFIIEALARHSVTEAYSFFNERTHVFFYNGLLIFLTSLPVFLFRRRRLARCILYGIWLLLGLSNAIILSSRVTPLTGPDFRNVSEAAALITKYLNPLEILGVFILLVVSVFFIIIYFFRCPRYKKKMHYLINIPMIALCVFSFLKFTNYYIEQDYLSSYFGNITVAYEDYGFPFCFTVTFLDTGIDEPNNYNMAAVDDIINKAKAETGETKADLNDLPNVIIVQLESFFDVSRVSGLKCSEDPLSNWHTLCKNYTSGLYQVPTFGAGTVNTEFETLTGMSMRFFGAGEYPYKSILKEETCESAASFLKKLGYTAFALHDNEANFYSRKVVYKNLGFDYFISGEYMQNQDDVNENGWMRDENLIEPMMECLDSTEGQDFLYTVSVQPHGSYPTEQVIEDPKITVSGSKFTEAQLNAWEYYVNQIYEEDQFIADLIQTVDSRDEDTIILFYGDHLPSMDLRDSDLKKGTTYDTCYLLWDNIGLKEKDRSITSYQAFATILNKLKIHEKNIFTFQQANMKQKDWNFTSKLQTLQYDALYGKKYLYNGKIMAANENYRLGLYDPEILHIQYVSDNIYRIEGEHFTESCKLFVNDEMAETLYVDENQLLVIKTEIKDGDVLKIGVQSNSSTHRILSESEPYTVPVTPTVSQSLTTEENQLISDSGESNK